MAKTYWTKNFITIVISNLCFFLSFQMIVPVIPLYIAELGGSTTAAGVVIAAGNIGGLLILPFAGYLIDTIGRRTVLYVGLALCTLTTGGYLCAVTLWILIICRIFYGFGMGTVGASMTSLATDEIAPKYMGRGMGVFGLSSALAMAAAPLFALSLYDAKGFRASFGLALIFAAIAFLLALTIKSDYKPPVKKDKLVLKPKELYDIKTLPLAFILAFQTASYCAVVTYIARYAQEAGISNIAYFYCIFTAGVLLCRLWSGRLADTRGFTAVIASGIIIFAASFLFFGKGGSLLIILIGGLIMGIGYGTSWPMLQGLAAKLAPPQRRGAVNGTMMSGFNLGFIIGSVSWGYLIDAIGYSATYYSNIIALGVSLVLFLIFAKKNTY